MRTILSLVDNERGAEMVEWILVVGLLAVAIMVVLGPNGVLYQAMSAGMQTIANVVTGNS